MSPAICHDGGGGGGVNLALKKRETILKLNGIHEQCELFKSILRQVNKPVTQDDQIYNLHSKLKIKTFVYIQCGKTNRVTSRILRLK